MKTDSLFYELFRFDPRSLFELVQLKLEGTYEFESITVKSAEKRIDGFFKRIDGDGPNVFLEVQGYEDLAIYWRTFREVCTHYEQTGSTTPFVIIILFVDKKYKPPNDCPLAAVSPHQLMIATLPDCLKAPRKHAGALTVLKPLVVSDKHKLPQLAQQWQTDIRALQLSEAQTQTLINLLEYAILERFPKLTLKEVEQMIKLTPLEETVAVQELIQRGEKRGMLKGREKGLQEGLQKGRRKGLQEGVAKGELIGHIHAVQQFLKRPLTPRNSLLRKNLTTLQMMLEQMKSELVM